MFTDVFAMPSEPIVVRSRFKCGHDVDELANGQAEVRNLRASAHFYDCVPCMIAKRKESMQEIKCGDEVVRFTPGAVMGLEMIEPTFTEGRTDAVVTK